MIITQIPKHHYLIFPSFRTEPLSRSSKFYASSMGKGKKKEDLKVVDVEFDVPMYCNACKRTVAKVISKSKGVETFTKDMNKHKVRVRGRIDAKTLLKKLKKKTKKRVEIVEKEKEKEERGSKEEEGIEVIVPPEELHNRFQGRHSLSVVNIATC